MIICYSKNFCFIRVPKSASTTASLGLVNSGIINPELDYCSISIEFDQLDNLAGKAEIFKNTSVGADIKSLLQKKDRTHHSFSYYDDLGLIPQGMQVYSTIRHPVERFLSFVKFIYKDPDPNSAWDHWKESMNKSCLDKSPLLFNTQNLKDRMFKPQHWWFGNNAKLWPSFLVDTCLRSFLRSQGYSYNKEKYRVSQRQLSAPLAKCKIDEILSIYNKDYLLWKSVERKYTANNDILDS